MYKDSELREWIKSLKKNIEEIGEVKLDLRVLPVLEKLLARLKEKQATPEETIANYEKAKHSADSSTLVFNSKEQAQEITVDYPEVIEEHDFYLIETDDTYYVQRKHPENATHRDLSEKEKIICKLAKAVQEMIKSKLGGKE